jgi:hypothetical protein
MACNVRAALRACCDFLGLSKLTSRAPEALELVRLFKPAAWPNWSLLAYSSDLLGMRLARCPVGQQLRPVALQAGALQAAALLVGVSSGVPAASLCLAESLMLCRSFGAWPFSADLLNQW